MLLNLPLLRINHPPIIKKKKTLEPGEFFRYPVGDDIYICIGPSRVFNTSNKRVYKSHSPDEVLLVDPETLEDQPNVSSGFFCDVPIGKPFLRDYFIGLKTSEDGFAWIGRTSAAVGAPPSIVGMRYVNILKFSAISEAEDVD